MKAQIGRILALGLGLSALVVAPATAGGPTFHDRIFDDSGIDTNFCGTGETIHFDGRAIFNVWLGETGGDPEQGLKATFTYRYTLTNPETGAAIIDSAAGQDLNVIVAGQESGPHTHEFTAKGLRGKLQLANGRVLLRDAGSITYLAMFDALDNFLGVEIVRVSGPHPGFANDKWCDAAIAALGF